MIDRLKATLPLAISVGVLAFIWVEVSLNFTFHWVTSGDLGIGLALPSNFHLVPPAAFLSWAVFFAAGADTGAVAKTLMSSAVGATAALVLMLLGPVVADLPDFWGLAAVTGPLAAVAVLLMAVGDWYFAPGAFVAFAAVVFWWFATGMDGWADGGGGAGNSVAALGKSETAGSGSFGGVLSTPVPWIYVSVLASLVCGALLGLASVKIAALLARPARSSAGMSANA